MIYYSNSLTETVLPGFSQDPTVDNVVVRRVSKYKEGERTPDYGTYRPGDSLPVHAYEIRDFRLDATAVPVNDPVYPHRQASLGMWGKPVEFSGIDVQVDERAIKSFNSNLDYYDSSIGVTIAELPKTISHIGQTATRIATIIKDLKRGNLTGAFQALGIDTYQGIVPAHKRALIKSHRLSKKNPRGVKDFASNAWLELTYGWTPLLMEIDNAARDLAKAWDGTAHDIVVRGTAADKSVNRLGTQSWSEILSQSVVHANEYTYRVGYTARIRVIDPELRKYSALGITNPLEIAWELMPYSFVADWFIPIGSWIDNLDAYLGLELLALTKSEKRTKILSMTLPAGSTVSGEEWLGVAQLNTKERKFQRSVLTNFPSIPFRIKGLSEALGTKRTLSALALFNNAMR
jgi:hypothetical protein